jgi:apolipoprotein N-acyltransferase
LLLAQYRVMPPRLSSLAPAIAVGGWLGGYLLPVFASYTTYMNWLPLIVGALMLLTAKGDRAFHERTGYRWFALHGALVWVGGEMIRGFIPIAGTWGFLANTLYAQPWLIQPVSIFSIFGLGLLIMLVNYVLSQGTLALFDRRWHLDPGLPPLEGCFVRRWLAGVGIAAIAWTGLSLALFRPPARPTIRVAAIQVPEKRDTLRFQQLQEQSREAARQGAQLIVWPEGALNFDPQLQHTAELRSLAGETNAYIAMGYFLVQRDGTMRNEATVLSPTGEFLGVYGKAHPVPFTGEYNTSLGTFPVYETPIGKLGTIICYDLDFTDTARKVTRNGAQLIAVPSQDSPSVATKHYTHLVFRAVENRVSMVKSDGGYDSAVVDSYGRIIEKVVTPEGAQATLVTDVPLGTGDSLAVRLGDWMGWLSLAGAIFFLVFIPVTMRRTTLQ